MLLDKTIKHRTDKIQLLLKEFSRQIQKSNTLALDLLVLKEIQFEKEKKGNKSKSSKKPLSAIGGKKVIKGQNNNKQSTFKRKSN